MRAVGAEKVRGKERATGQLPGCGGEGWGGAGIPGFSPGCLGQAEWSQGIQEERGVSQAGERGFLGGHQLRGHGRGRNSCLHKLCARACAHTQHTEMN